MCPDKIIKAYIFDLFLLITDRTIGFKFFRVLDESNSTIFQINLDTFVFKLPNLDTFTSNFLQSAHKCVCSRRSPY